MFGLFIQNALVCEACPNDWIMLLPFFVIVIAFWGWNVNFHVFILDGFGWFEAINFSVCTN